VFEASHSKASDRFKRAISSSTASADSTVANRVRRALNKYCSAKKFGKRRGWL
jgi:hypothetical protein